MSSTRGWEQTLQKLRSFWTEFYNRPDTRAWAEQHPSLAGRSVADLVCTIPCSLHCDAGPITKRKSATVVSWASLLADGPEKKTQYVIFS